jgi:D-3-phosphoglycerate dehydrogenase
VSGTEGVFICRDTVHRQLLEDVADRLRARAVAVQVGDLEADGPWTRSEVILATIRQQLNRERLDRAVRLSGVVYPTIGLDSLDLAAADRLGIVVGHGATPENFVGMAEATLTLALALVYRLHEAEDLLRRNGPKPSPPRSAMLQGKTAGLIGVGRIGSVLAARLAAFGTHIIACTRSGRPVANVARMVGLNELLAASDIVFVLATLNEESRGMLGYQQLSLMKPTAYLVNTARGELIDEPALARILGEGRIAGAALDVFEREPLAPDSALRSLPNVILTPHMIGHTIESTDSLMPAAVENVAAILDGRLPPICANPGVEARWRKRRGRLAERRAPSAGGTG